MYTQTPFPPDYPGALVVPAHPNNVIDRPSETRGFIIHAPEEPVDDIESTPAYFARNLLLAVPPRRASTKFYNDSDGDVYQMVPVNIGAIANGLLGRPCPEWADPNISLNLQTENTEVEGYAAGMWRTCRQGGRQWNSVVKLIEYRSFVTGFPLDRIHVLGHYQVSNQRTCPGTLDIDGIVLDAQKLREEREGMTEIELIKLLDEWQGSAHELAAFIGRREKLPTGLIARIQLILNLAKQ